MTENEFCIMIVGFIGLYVCFYVVASDLDRIHRKLKKLESRKEKKK